MRAAELADALDTLLAETGAAKAHLWGHSQAGLDLRVLLSPGGLDDGARVASVTTAATPHRGLRNAVPVAPDTPGMDVTEAYITGGFASANPDAAGVPFFSWAAATCGALDSACLSAHDGEVVPAPLASGYLDPRALYAEDGEGGDNDGVVPVSSARWGIFLGVLDADHWDLVGQIPGARLGTFDPEVFFLSEARRLRRLEQERGL